MKVIARLRCDFPDKFGRPRQSGLAPSLQGLVVFEPAYRDVNALRGLEGFSHLWLIWQFSRVQTDAWSPTVRPPRLGGNARMGVFATRSPFRPNPIGLSCVRLLAIETHPGLGAVLRVGGADLMDGTPIYDIKPYLPYADCVPDAVGGFASEAEAHRLDVRLPEPLASLLPEDRRAGLIEALSQDPRPPYRRHDPSPFALRYADCEVRFQVEADVLTVIGVERAPKHS